jgi:sugar lactone lactonase YvrE
LPYFRLIRFAILISVLAGSLSAQALFSKPVTVLDDPAFIGTAANPLLLEGNGPNWVEGRELSSPLGIALDLSVSPPIVYIADAGNNRVLGYQYATQLKAGSFADLILGQIDRFSNLTSSQNGRTSSMNQPSGLAVDGNGILYVADTGNNRILRYTRPFSQPSGSTILPDMVIGQTSLAGRTANAGGIGASTLSLSTSTTYRSGLAIDSAGNLWVADTGNNRVLRYPAAVLAKGQNGPAADTVVGQVDFVSTVRAGSRTSTTNLALPQGLAFDPEGRLLVTDAESRVVVYPTSLGTNAVASRILGFDTTQGSSSTTQIAVNTPLGVAGTAEGVIVADSFNNRVLVFPIVDNWPAQSTQFSPSANLVVGQTSYTVSMANQGNGDASAASFNTPADVAASATELFVADAANNRVLVFPLNSAGLATTASRVIGQLDFPYFAPNLIEGP